MSDISSFAYHQCHWVLQQCSEFDSNDSLRAFFAAPALRFLQNTLPQADDKEARVMKAVSFLTQKRDKDGTLALAIFVNELLQHRSFEEDLYHQLKNLEDQIQRDLVSHELLEIPVVVAAMNQSQAARLLMGDVFEDSGVKIAPVSRARFEELKKHLQDHAAAVLSSYRPDREDWQILVREIPDPEFVSIRQIVEDISMHINDKYQKPNGLPTIHLKFRSGDFFDPLTGARTWYELRRTGCVLIVDAVSLFHPSIQDTLGQSGLIANDLVAMFVLSPLSSFSHPVNGFIQEEINQSLQLIFTRFDEHLDKLCEFGFGGIRSLKRWLSMVVPEVESGILNPKPDPLQKQRMNQQYGPPSGISKKIFQRSW